MLIRRKAGESASAKADECQAKVVIMKWLLADIQIVYQTIYQLITSAKAKVIS